MGGIIFLRGVTTTFRDRGVVVQLSFFLGILVFWVVVCGVGTFFARYSFFLPQVLVFLLGFSFGGIVLPVSFIEEMPP